MLFAKNAPEWAMAYFGMLKAGATSVPVGHESTVAELVNVARASGAVGMLIGDDLLREERGRRCRRALAEAGLTTKLWSFSEAFVLPDLEVEKARAPRRWCAAQSPDALASLIFTSGTTGKPKGVMLTHRNFTFMVSELSKIFEFGVTDGMLSVLPLQPHVRVRDRPAGAAGARRADHLPARADGRRDLVGAEARARHRHRRRAGAVGSAAAPPVPALRRQVAGAGRLHAPAREGELRAAQPRRLRRRDAAFPARARGFRRPHPLPDQRRLGAARGGAGGVLRAWASTSSRATA